MLHRNSSAGTTAQKSSKCSLIQRPAITLAMLLLVAVFGCKEPKAPVNKIVYKQDTASVINAVIENPEVEKIVILPAMVTDGGSFGYVSKGSILFDYSNCQKGYIIQVKLGDRVVSTSICPKYQLQKYLDIIKYEMSVKDTVGLNGH